MSGYNLDGYDDVTGKKIIEEFGIEPISTNLKFCRVVAPEAILTYNLRIPLFARLYKESDYEFCRGVHCTNYKGFLIRLSFTPSYLFFYLWPGDDDDFKNICQNGGGIKNLMEILHHLEININFANKYNLK